jgi:hypothetical protein
MGLRASPLNKINPGETQNPFPAFYNISTGSLLHLPNKIYMGIRASPSLSAYHNTGETPEFFS